MLVYLLFIFSCGWCVCWLLFLNYQQHTQDGAKLSRLKRQLRSSRLARRAGSKRASLLRAPGYKGPAHDVTCRASLSRCQDIDIESSARHDELHDQHHLGELVVDSQGRHHHRRRRRSNSDFRSPAVNLELDGFAAMQDAYEDEDLGLTRRSFDLAEDELDDLELLEMNDFDEFCSPAQVLPLDEIDWPDNLVARRPPHATSESNEFEEVEELIRSWPGGDLGDAQDEELQATNEQEEQDDELLDLWQPLVELHENPLNLIEGGGGGGQDDDATRASSHFNQCAQNQHEIFQGQPGNEGHTSSTGSCSEQLALLERSRLLSLSQREHRAAIRMISPDSVQLFVQETQLLAARNREEPTRGEGEAELAKLKSKDELANNNQSNNNNLLMMMQQPRPAQPTTSIGNNDTHGGDGGGGDGATETNRWPPLIAEGYNSARLATSAGSEVTLAATSALREGAGIERQEDRLQRVDALGEEEEEEEQATAAAAAAKSQRQQTAGETTGDSSSSSASIRGGGGDGGVTGKFISSERLASGGDRREEEKNEISRAQVSKQRQLAAVVVERAINLRMQSASEQQTQAQIAASSTSAGCLPTLQQVQRQMQAAQAQLEQRQQERKQQVATATAAAAAAAAAQAKPAFKHDEEIQQRAAAAADDERPDSSSAASAQAAGQPLPATTKKPKTLQPSNGRLGSSLPEEISPKSDTQSRVANHLLKSSSSLADREIISDHSGRQLSQAPLRGENDSTGQQQQQNQVGLQSEQVKSNLDCVAVTLLDNNNSQKPIPTPRFQQQQQQLLFRNELTIETRCLQPPVGFGLPQSVMMNQRIKDLSNELSLLSTPSGQSTPTNSSMLSDCSTTISVARLLTEAEMNSSELIPKLIERLDRKLVVMKKEQFALMKEIEYNEACGQQLFDSMRQQLTVAEFDKIQTHANEIEKVTKLILSLKLRLKRIEQELKAEQKSAAVAVSDQCQSQDHEAQQQHQQQQQHDSLLLNDSTSSSSSSSSSSCSSSSSGEHPSLLSSSSSEHHKVKQSNHSTNTSQLPSQAHQQQQQQHKTISSTTTCDDASSCYHLAMSSVLVGKQQQQQQPMQRGVSDPTSTVGLPKRNHHHHASLQAPAKLDSTSAAGCQSIGSQDRQVSAGSATSNGGGGGGSETHHRRQGKPPSTSSDSIFNSADSAIGSCTIINSSASSGHGGSSSNLAHDEPRTANKSTSSASQAATHHHHHHHHLHDSDQLSSGLSAGSRSSLSSSSTPSSPSLMSPTVSTSSSDANNNRGASSDKTTRAQDAPTTCESLLNLISDLDILMAKRNKLVAQLEEAHQLEECIARRNNNLVERILKKYYQEDKPAAAASETLGGGEIALFRQFTKLKSLLLKDSHDINDRIENAELQLSELKQTSQCQV